MQSIKKIVTVNDCLLNLTNDLIVLPVFSEELKESVGFEENEFLSELKKLYQEDFFYSLKRLNFTAEALSECAIHCPQGLSCLTLLFVGLGGKNGSTSINKERTFFRMLGGLVSRKTIMADYKSLAVLISKNFSSMFTTDNQAAFYEGYQLAGYNFNLYKGEKRQKDQITEFRLVSEKKLACVDLKITDVMLKAVSFARNLVNTPSNDCTPQTLVSVCKNLAKESLLEIECYDKEELAKLGANGILAVGKGSALDPFFVKLSYKQRGKTRKKVALVGKGVTFDSGGLSLKHDDKMALMKCDMAGVASAIAVMQAIAELDLGVEVNAYLPLAENLINGNAVKPGDVIKTLSGKTVEVINTDCEGRLLLADAFEFANRDQPDILIDVATLTFSVMKALGNEIAALYSNDRELASAIQKAGDYEGENFWEMPLPKNYRKNNFSLIADLKNFPDSSCGSISAALFLEEFLASGIKWAHFDISGVAYSTLDRFHQTIGATGFATKTILRFLIELSKG